MSSTSKEVVAFKPSSGEGTLRLQLRTCLFASALILAGLTVADPALAPAAPLMAHGALVVMTRRGACESRMRYRVQIINGQVVGREGGASVQGRVAHSGAVRISVQAGGQWAAPDVSE